MRPQRLDRTGSGIARKTPASIPNQHRFRFSPRRSVHCLAIALLMVAACDRPPAATTAPDSNRSESSTPSTPTQISRFPLDQLGAFYQANGLLEMDKPGEAAERYRALLTRSNRDPAIIANLAIACLALQLPAEADQLSGEAFQLAPDHPGIALVRAAVLAGRGEMDAATALLQQACNKNPRNVSLLWALLALRESRGDAGRDESADLYDQLLRLAPNNVAALLSALRAHAAAGRLKVAEALHQRLAALLSDPPDAFHRQSDLFRNAVARNDSTAALRAATIERNVLRQTDRFRYDLLALGPSGTNQPGMIRHPLGAPDGNVKNATRAVMRFEEDAAALTIRDAASKRGTITNIVTGTLTSDRRPAVLALLSTGQCRLFRRTPSRFDEFDLAGSWADGRGIQSARFLDVNNDRRMDVYLCMTGGDRLLAMNNAGGFTDATDAAGLRSLGESRGVCPFDVDNDGDLDLLRWTASDLTILRNDGEGRFTRLDPRPGLPADLAAIQSIEPTDLDDDGDVDLFITLGISSSEVNWRIISNERLATFRDMTAAMSQLPRHFACRPILADLNHDGRMEILDVPTGTAYSIGDDFIVDALTGLSDPMPDAASAAAMDFDCDGQLDIIAVRPDGSTTRSDVHLNPGEGLIALDVDGDGLPDLMSSSGRVFMNRTVGAGQWLNIGLHALIAGDSRFNAFGLFSTIEIRAGAMYQKQTVTSATTHFGLGPYAHADVVRVVWPNGNYQNLEFRASDRVNLAANQTLIEEQTLKGSCPYLYAWNGREFRFVTDVLWRSALGMSIMSGVYGHHGSANDYFKITGEQLSPRNGEFVLQFTEELWEAAYFDLCELMVVDHPIGTDVFVDEKCLTPPYPPFELYPVREARSLQSAIDHQGRDVTPLLHQRDDQYVANFRPTRYQGLVENHDLILELGAFPKDATVRLFMQGWLYPTDASTNVAVSQNPDIRVAPPVFSVVDQHQRWQPLDLACGFPSGKDKTLVYDLTGRFPTSDHRLKLSTNFAIYWDHAFITVGEQTFESKMTRLSIHSAELHDRGFSHEFRRAPDGPMIPEYDALDPLRCWRDLIGNYTRFGDVAGLLSEADSRYVIVGPGDEITLRFKADALPPLPRDWRRDFIIHTDGWLKDGDLNSATGKAVAPLPFAGMSAYPYPNTESPPDDPAPPNRSRPDQRWRDSSAFRDWMRNRRISE